MKPATVQNKQRDTRQGRRAATKARRWSAAKAARVCKANTREIKLERSDVKRLDTKRNCMNTVFLEAAIFKKCFLTVAERPSNKICPICFEAVNTNPKAACCGNYAGILHCGCWAHVFCQTSLIEDWITCHRCGAALMPLAKAAAKKRLEKDAAATTTITNK